MKIRKVPSIIAIVCILVLTANISCYEYANAATASAFKIHTDALSKSSGNSLIVSLEENTNVIAGIELFIAFDTDVFSVESVRALLPDSWELDWAQKTNATYGSGIHCMVQDTELKGFSDAAKEILEIQVDGQKASIGSGYDFEVYVIDVCNEEGDSIRPSVGGAKESIECIEGLPESEEIQLLGYQISTTLEGLRTVSAVEPEIRGQKVVEFGNVYGVVLNNLREKDVYVREDSVYVKAYAATQQGITDFNFSGSDTATHYVRTMIHNGATKPALTQKYIARAYAKLEDGTYVYSKASTYSIFNVADILYQNLKMPNYAGHSYLYNSILKVVDSDYKEVDFNWNGSFVK